MDGEGPHGVGSRCLTTRRIGFAERPVSSEITSIRPSLRPPLARGARADAGRARGGKELPDGRLIALIKQSGIGAHSGVDVDLHYVQIYTFANDRIARVEVFTTSARAVSQPAWSPEVHV
jgi:hypothetical protein